MEYFWANDPMFEFTKENHEYNFHEMVLIPRGIKKQMVIDFIFQDLFNENRMMKPFSEEREFLYVMSLGFMPRLFEADDIEDRIIYDQEDEVEELYFMTKCHVGIAIPSN